MGDIKVSIDKIKNMHAETQTFLNDINKLIADTDNDLDSIKVNWEGKKSAVILNNIDIIKSTHKDLILKIEENGVYLNGVVEVFESAENATIESSNTAQSYQKPEPSIPVIVSSPEVQIPLQPTYTPSSEKIKVDDVLLNQLGVKRDSNGNPIKVRNMYVVRKQFGTDYNDYLLFLPEDKNGEIPKNLQIILENHGNGGSRTYTKNGMTQQTKIEDLDQYEMGINFTAKNGDFPAIFIMPQASNPGNVGKGSDQFNEIYHDVLEAFDAREDGAIVVGFSAGGATTYRYAKDHSDDIKAIYLIDPSTYADKFQNVSEDMPITFFTSQRTSRDSDYTRLILNSVKSLGRDIKVYDPIIPTGVNFKGGIDNYNVNDPAAAQNKIVAILKESDRPGARLVNVPTTNHIQVKDLVLADHFYYTIKDVWFGK